MVIKGEPHLKLTTRANTTALVLPVAHTFSRCGGHITELTKTFGELGRFVGCICRMHDGDREERAHYDAIDGHAFFRYHGFGVRELVSVLPPIASFFSSFPNFPDRFQQRTHSVFALRCESVSLV